MWSSNYDVEIGEENFQQIVSNPTQLLKKYVSKEKRTKGGRGDSYTSLSSAHTMTKEFTCFTSANHAVNSGRLFL
jgi:hypothetical protein